MIKNAYLGVTGRVSDENLPDYSKAGMKHLVMSGITLQNDISGSFSYEKLLWRSDLHVRSSRVLRVRYI